MKLSPDDRAMWTKERKVLTCSQLNIPGLHMMGCADYRSTFNGLDPHYHNYLEFVAVIKGRQQYIGGEQIYVLHGGEVFLTCPGEEHGNGGLPQEICEFVWFQIDCRSLMREAEQHGVPTKRVDTGQEQTASDNFLGLAHPYSEYLYQQLQTYRNRITYVSQEDLQKLRRAFYLLADKDMHKHMLGHSLFLEFVVGNLTISETNNVKTGSTVDESEEEVVGNRFAQQRLVRQNWDISDALTYMHAHLTENPSLESIAEHCGLSPSRFVEAFKEQMGITPHAYMTNLKIDSARILLKNPENSITDVAMQLNFSSGNHFSAVFKRYTGRTPSQYRTGS